MGKSNVSRAAVESVALLLAVALTACEEDEPSGSTPPRSPSQSESSSPSEPATAPTGPVEPTLPPAAKAGDKAGAEAFVEFYWDAVSYALVTGDIDLLTALAGPECAGCMGGTEFIRRVYDKGGSIEADPYRVLSATATPLGSSDAAPIFGCEVQTRSSRQVVRVPGKAIQRVDPVTESFDFTVIFTEGHWRVDLLEKP